MSLAQLVEEAFGPGSRLAATVEAFRRAAAVAGEDGAVHLFEEADGAADAAAGRLLTFDVARLVDAGADAKLVHGKATAIDHDGRGLFAGLPAGFAAGRSGNGLHVAVDHRIDIPMEKFRANGFSETLKIAHLAAAHLPGPLTLILPRTAASIPWDLGGDASTIGVRPNSPPQMTSVSSSRPRCFKSCNSAPSGWSTTAQLKGKSCSSSL